jgi:Cu(I)/Ag(I) efflux system protein CusF
MKTIANLSILAMLLSAGVAQAGQSGQSGDRQAMDMKGMHPSPERQAKAAPTPPGTHKASGTVRAVDPDQGTVTLAHGPVPTLKWPAMTMRFAVKDKHLFDKLPVGRKVDVEFAHQGSDYVVTAVK